MGGQACVLYGAAEFSRDTDLVILADADNIVRRQSQSVTAIAMSVVSAGGVA